MSKYNSNKVEVDGYKFDSRDESIFYEYLLKLKAQGDIINFEMQPKYELIPAFFKDGKKYRPITYILDFLLYHNDGTEELIDVKGMSTQQGELRRKLFDYRYSIKLTWIARSLKYGDEHGWIQFDELKKIRAKNKREKAKNG